MDKRRDSRQEIPLSNLAATGESSHQEPRLSSRLSGADFAVADGFRPVSPLSPSPSPSLVEERHPPLNRSVSLPVDNEPGNRSSIAKRPGVGMALSDEQRHRDHGHSEQYFDPNTSRFISRPSSSSSVSYDSSTSPYRTRISRISFSYPRRPTTPSGPSIQPAHPYALYQQTTFEEPEEIEEVPPTQHIPIGFNGQPNRYRRTTGPDGEELEVMGPDGHMEQLPPYSRYPEAGPLPQKSAMVNTSPVSSFGDPGAESSNMAPATPVSTTVSPIIPSAPATPYVGNNAQNFGSMNQFGSSNQVGSSNQLGSMHQLQTNQTQQSTSPQSPTGAPTTHSSFTSDPRANRSSASSLAEEKNRGNGGWSSIKRKRVLCGIIPLWAAILIVILFLFLAIVAGGVLGGLLSQRGEKKHRPSNSPQSTSFSQMYDASPIPAPTGIPPMPTGRFFFPLGASEGQERSCIEPSQDSIAWECGGGQQLMLMDFNYNSTTTMAALTLSPAESMPGSNGIFYGPQPPRIAEQRLMWVTDLRDPGRGPALHFQTAYDKIVLFEGNSFPKPNIGAQRAMDIPANNLLDKRHDTMPADQGVHNHRFANSPGETPWYCFWNQTFIEGFIYIQQPVHGAETQQFAVSTMLMMMTEMNKATATAATSASSPPKPTTSPTGSPVFLSSSTPQRQLQPRATVVLQDASIPLLSSPSLGGIPSAPTPPPSRFPFIIKIEERRLPNPAFTPFCQRMRVLLDGSTVPLLNDNGNPIVEVVREAPTNKGDAQITAGVMTGQSGHSRKGAVADSVSMGSGRKHRRRWEMPPPLSEEWGVGWDGKAKLIRRNQEPSNSCHCVWVSPYS